MSLINIEEPSISKGNNNSNNYLEPIFGIDFGTTNSLVALYQGGEAIIIPDSKGNALLPSVVSFTEAGPIVGLSAKDSANAIFSVKRLLGRNLEGFKKKYPFINITDNLNLSVEGKKINIISVAQEIFKALKKNVKSGLNIELKKAVITVPAYFDNSSRNAVKDAAKIAGIEAVRMLSEPTAAALFYGVDQAKAYGCYVVYDLGGGTFDVSLLEFHKGIFKVGATGGDDLLGGDDFDKLLAEYLILILKLNSQAFLKEVKDISEDGGISFELLTTNQQKIILKIAKAIKEKLNSEEYFEEEQKPLVHREPSDFSREIKKLLLNFLQAGEPENNLDKENDEAKAGIKVNEAHNREELESLEELEKICLSITLEDFNQLIEKTIKKTIKELKNVISNATKTIEEIDGIILVGGSTRIKLISEELVKIFGKEKVFNNIDPDTIVAKGAALYASYLSGANKDKTLLVDVLPLSLGIEAIGGITEKLILKDSQIPLEETQTFTNYIAGQTSFKIHVVQGEREFVKDNRSLAEFILKNIPPLPAGKARIEIKFKVNEDGILTVTACEKTRNIRQEIEINPSYGLAKEEIEKMIKDSYQHAKEDIEGKKLVEIKQYANKILEIIEAAIKEDARNNSLQSLEVKATQPIGAEGIENSTYTRKLAPNLQGLVDNSSEKITNAFNKVNNNIGAMLENNNEPIAAIKNYTEALKAALRTEDYDNINLAVQNLEEGAAPFLKERLANLIKNMELQIK